MLIKLSSVFGLALISAGMLLGADSVKAPRPVPLTRPEMKEYLEDMKVRKPRIPLPELTDEEKANAAERGGGRIGGGYEGRLRSLYLSNIGGGGFGGFGGGRTPPADGAARGVPPAGTPAPGTPAAPGTRRGFGGAGQQNSDSNMTLDYAFKTELFWIVSRTNNCQYCLGHQESKLLGAGLNEDQIAALDGDWSEFTPKERAAFTLARKMTFAPHLLADADIDQVRKHYTDLQILEMILSVAGNNSLNRWKEGVGVPQSQNGGGFGRRSTGANPGSEVPAARPVEAHGYLTPTSDKYKTAISKVAPFVIDEKTGQATHQTVCNRPALESREDVERGLAECRKRTPRLPLADESAARLVIPEDWPAGGLSQWVRLLANFPREGRRTLTNNRNADEKGDLTPVLKAQISWIIARQDRAWYATGEAKQRLLKLGQTEDQIYKLDGSWEQFTPAERALFTVAKNLAATPVVLTDDEVDEALKQTSPRDVVQVISYTTGRASFDRITEAAGLKLED